MDEAGLTSPAAEYGWDFASVVPVISMTRQPPTVTGWSSVSMEVTLATEAGAPLAEPLNATFAAKLGGETTWRSVCEEVETCVLDLTHLAVGEYVGCLAVVQRRCCECGRVHCRCAHKLASALCKRVQLHRDMAGQRWRQAYRRPIRRLVVRGRVQQRRVRGPWAGWRLGVRPVPERSTVCRYDACCALLSPRCELANSARAPPSPRTSA